MKGCRKPRGNKCHCPNCNYDIRISPGNVKEKTFESLHSRDQLITATYIECPVCGERLLKQLDTPETAEIAEKGVKLELLQRKGKKLSDKQKARLKSIEQILFNARKKLNEIYWDEIYQSLNQYEDEKTGVADQELMLGNQVTNAGKLGERKVEHV